ncbi:MAG: hypothetical protein F9K40_11950 [Kofleriaceae bacterium]|nr:MAG: hypothetical protein F9K40_11950 [Kofleriaceae bacterium]
MTIRKLIANSWIDILSLIVISVIFVVPFIFIFLMAAKTGPEAALFQFTWPGQFQLFENIREVLEFGDGRMFLALWNSTLLTVGSVTLIVLFSALVAFVMQRRRGRARRDDIRRTPFCAHVWPDRGRHSGRVAARTGVDRGSTERAQARESPAWHDAC